MPYYSNTLAHGMHYVTGALWPLTILNPSIDTHQYNTSSVVNYLWQWYKPEREKGCNITWCHMMSHDVTQCHMMSDDVTSFVCSEDYQTLDFQSSSFGKTPPLWWAFKHKDSFPPLVSTLLCRFSYFAKHHWGGVVPKELDWKSKVWICIDGLWHNYLIQQSTWL